MTVTQNTNNAIAIEQERNNNRVVRHEEDVNVQAPPAKKRCRRKRVPDMYGARIFNSGLAPRPTNPYFVTSINVSRKNYLYIPMDVVKRMRVETPIRMRLVDQRGREYDLKRKLWNHGRILYVDGWNAFCKTNDLDEKDQCIVEFITGEDGAPKLRATIIRDH